MKKFLGLLIVLLSLSLTACGSEASKATVDNFPAPETVIAENPTGFLSYPWDTSFEKINSEIHLTPVAQSHPKSPQTSYFYKAQDKSHYYFFQFRHGKLIQGRIYLQNQEEYEKMKKLLILKLGTSRADGNDFLLWFLPKTSVLLAPLTDRAEPLYVVTYMKEGTTLLNPL
jgi:hypothetical protein